MKISMRERRVLVVGGLAVAAILAGVYVVEPLVVSQLQVREEIRQKTALLERHQLLASEKGRYQRRVEALRSEVRQAEELHFKGDKLPVVAAEIQGLLHKLGEEAGITIARENVPAPKKGERFTQVIVELSVRGDMRAISDFLYKVHTAPKMLAVSRLNLKGAPGRGGPAPLLADLQIAGHMVGVEEKPSGTQPSAQTVGPRVAWRSEK
jgi:Tfp pilus assembly protein PilO